MHRLFFVLILAALASGSSLDAQPPTPPPGQPPIVRPQGEGFLIDFQNQDIRLVISALAEAAGLNVTFTNIPNTPTTLRLSQPISRGEIPDILRSIVESNNLRMVEDGPVIRIERVTPLNAQQLALQAQQLAAPQLAYIYRLRHANALQLANTLNQVFAPSIGGRGVPFVFNAVPPGRQGGAANQQGRGAGAGRGGAAGGGGGGRGGRGNVPPPSEDTEFLVNGAPTDAQARRSAAQAERVQLQTERLQALAANPRVREALAAQGGGEVAAQLGQLLASATEQLAAQASALQQVQPGSAGITGEVRVVPEESTNSLIIRATAADWAAVQQIIQAVDLRPPQVLIEVTIAEVRRSSSLDVGVSGSADYTKRGNTDPSVTIETEGPAPDPRAFILTLSGNRGAVDFDVAIRALAARGDVRVLSLPVIFGQNNREARLNVGSQVPFISLFRSLPTDEGVLDQVVEYRSVGTQLTIIPTINPDGYVNLQVTQTANSVTNEIQFGAPVINEREAATQIFVRDGQTAVIGGLADNQRSRTRSGIPVLNRIPVLGVLFGSTQHSDIVTELFLFLTPHVVQTDADTDRIRDAIREGLPLLRNEDISPLIPPATITVPPPAAPPPAAGRGAPPPQGGRGAPPPTQPPPPARPPTTPRAR
jgi:general secretion pathway protein D